MCSMDKCSSNIGLVSDNDSLHGNVSVSAMFRLREKFADFCQGKNLGPTMENDLYGFLFWNRDFRKDLFDGIVRLKLGFRRICTLIPMYMIYDETNHTLYTYEATLDRISLLESHCRWRHCYDGVAYMIISYKSEARWGAILDRIGREIVNTYHVQYNKIMVSTHHDSDQHHYTFDVDRKRLVRTSKDGFKKDIEKYSKIYPHTRTRKLFFEGEEIVLFSYGSGSWNSQSHKEFRSEMFAAAGGFPSILKDKFTDFVTSISTVAGKAMTGTAKVAVSGVFTAIETILSQFNYRPLLVWLLDFVSLILDFGKYFTLHSFISFVTRFCTLSIRLVYDIMGVRSDFRSESMDLATILVSLAAPEKLIGYAKKLNTLSELKLFSSKGPIMEAVIMVLNTAVELISWLGEKFPALQSVVTFITEKFSFVKMYKYEQKLRNIVTSFQKDPQSITRLDFRKSVLDLENSINGDGIVVKGCHNTDFRTYYDIFKHIHTAVSNYSACTRPEPVCIVFEGLPGHGKSVTVGKYQNFLAKLDFSVYAHTVPPLEGGKDWWDTYMDQDVVVFDDMGQQGISQWRQIINLIAPIAYPLDCASVEKKDLKKFTSKLVLVTTNCFSKLQGFTRADCIAEPTALFRRGLSITVAKSTAHPGKWNYSFKRYDYTAQQWTTAFDPQAGLKTLPSNLDGVTQDEALPWIHAIAMGHYQRNCRFFKENTRDMDTQAVNVAYNALKTTHSLEIPSKLKDISFESEVEWNIEGAKEFFGVIVGEVGNVLSDFFSSLVSRMASLCDIVKPALNKAGSLFKEHSTLLCLLLTEICVVLFACTFIRFMCKREDKPFPDGVVLYREQTNDYIVNGHVFAFESTVVSQQSSFTKNHLRYAAYKHTKMGIVHTAESAIIVSGKRAIIPLHTYVEGMTMDVAKTYDDMRRDVVELNCIPVKLIKAFPHLDLGVIEFNINHIIYKDGVDRMFPQKALSQFSMVTFLNPDFSKEIPHTNLTVNHAFSVKVVDFPAKSGFLYEGLTQLGLCGSVLFCQENGIVGIHVAGNGVHGFSIVPSKQDREDLRNYLSSGSCDYEIVPLTSVRNTDISGIRYNQNDLKPTIPLTKSSLIPTELVNAFDDIPHEKRAPPNFKAHGKDTMKMMTQKNFKQVPTLSDDELDFAAICIDDMLCDFDDLTEAEVVNGTDELSRLNRDSVNGYGYESDKNLYIDYENSCYRDGFRKTLDGFISKCESGNLSIKDLLSQEAFKDETRLLEKVDKPRVFRVMPLHHTVMMKTCLGKLLAHVKANMWDNQIAIGLNPYVDWAKLKKTFETLYQLFCDGDVGNWDGGCNPCIQRLINRLVYGRYKGKYPKVLKVLLESIVTTPVISGFILYLTTHSMPSGCWVTALFNSFINRAITAITLYREMRKVGKVPTLEDFKKIGDFVLGDDKLVGVPTELAPYVNALTLKSTFESLKMTFTDAEKGEIMDPFKPLDQCVFLKRSFKYHHGLNKIVGALSLDTVLGMMKYTDSRKDKDVVMAGKAVAFQYELFLHATGESLYLKTDDGFKIFNVEDIKQRVKDAYEIYGYLWKDMTNEHMALTMQSDKFLYRKIMAGMGKNFFN